MKEKFLCIAENNKRSKTFSVPIKKEITKADKERNENLITISYKIKFNASGRFMASSLLNLYDSLIKFKDLDFFTPIKSVYKNLTKYRCLPFSKNYSNKIAKT